jgi:antirestriction protein ArdC
MSIDLYTRVTESLIAMLEAGCVPWRNPILGRGAAGHPRNFISGKPYRGVNVFLLAFAAWSKGYSSSCWLTFNQARAKGGSVKKGEKSCMVVFWKPYETTDKETGEKVTIPVLRHFNVFNAEQCDGIQVPDAPAFEPLAFSPIDECEKIVKGYEQSPSIEHGGSQPYYSPSLDTVRLPEPTRFESCEEYYGTLFHELAHSTGHKSRLDRGQKANSAPFGSPDYGKEELIAEMAAAFLCGHAGISPVTIDNAAAYLAGWIKTLKGDHRLAISAAGAAQKAADWIRGERSVRASETPQVEAA